MLRCDLGSDGRAAGLWGWEQQCCPHPGPLCAIQQMLGRRWQLPPSTIGFSPPRGLIGTLQQREKRIWGEMQGRLADRAAAPLLIATVSPRLTPPAASALPFSTQNQPTLRGRTRWPGFPTSHPLFFFFYSVRLFSRRGWLRGGRGGKCNSSVLQGSLKSSLAEVRIHPRGCPRDPEPPLDETWRWVGVWGRRGEWEQAEGMSSAA